MKDFIMSSKIYMGEQSCSKIKEYDIKKALVICDPFMETSGKVKLLTKNLDAANINYEVYSKIKPDPDLSIIKDCLNHTIGSKPDTIICFGGGSAIDTAKAVSLLYSNMEGNKKPTLIAIPTTSGTGSEVTSFAVISDKDAGVKYPLISNEIIPNVVFLDSALTETVPPSVTADTGLDVLTHALEAFVSTKANDFTDANAEKAIKMVFKYLERCVANGSDMDARDHMHNASCMAGIAFNTASLGICHSMAHALGERFHLPHGRCNALLLPFVIEYNAELDTDHESAALDRYYEISTMLGIQAGTKKATVHNFIRQIRNLMIKVGIPTHFSEIGIEPEAFLEAINHMSENALKDRCTETNPKIPTLDEFKLLYLRFYKY